MSDEKKGMTGSLGDQRKGATRGTIEALALKMGINPSESAWVAVDIGASLAGISIKTTVDFFKAAPEVARLLENDDVRAWAELGRRVALHNAEEASEFFRTSGETLAAIPDGVRPVLIALCSRQIVLSPAAATTTFHSAPRIFVSMGDEAAAARIFGIAVEVAQRSVKHSTEVLESAPRALAAMQDLETRLTVSPDPIEPPTMKLIDLAEQFASRTGATAAEFLGTVGEGLDFVDDDKEVTGLASQTASYLDRGGAPALQFFRSARTVIEFGGASSFEKWGRVVAKVADEGNALVYDFLKLTPKVIAALALPRLRRSTAEKNQITIDAVLDIVEELTTINVHMALECFKSSPRAIARATIDQFQTWAREGVAVHKQDRRRAQAYFALESKTSQEVLKGAEHGVESE